MIRMQQEGTFKNSYQLGNENEQNWQGDCKCYIGYQRTAPWHQSIPSLLKVDHLSF